MMPTSPLEQLKDIIEPGTVPGWWPPAPGWWLLAALLLALLIWLLIRLRRYWRDRQARVIALMELARIQGGFQYGADPQTILAELNRLLKRVAISRYGREPVAALHGEAWCRFLSERAPGVDFTGSPGRFLADGLYQRSRDVPLEALFSLAEQWLRRCR